MNEPNIIEAIDPTLLLSTDEIEADLDEGADFTADRAALIDSILDGTHSSPVFIDDLADAVVNGTFTLREGDLLVVEKWLTINAAPKWLGTSMYRISRIDPLDESGDLGLHDEELRQGASANWKTGPRHGWRFKVGHEGLNLNKRSKGDFVPPVAADPAVAPKAKRVKRTGDEKRAYDAHVAEILKGRAERKAARQEKKNALRAGKA